MLRVDFPTDQVRKDLELTRREVLKAQQRAIFSSTRKFRTELFRDLRTDSDVKDKSIRNRIKSFPSKGKIWLGILPVLATSLKTTKLIGGGRGKAKKVVVNGAEVPGGFAHTQGRYKNIPFKRTGLGKSLETIKGDFNVDAQGAFNRLARKAPDILIREFNRLAEVAIRERK